MGHGVATWLAVQSRFKAHVNHEAVVSAKLCALMVPGEGRWRRHVCGFSFFYSTDLLATCSANRVDLGHRCVRSKRFFFVANEMGRGQGFRSRTIMLYSDWYWTRRTDLGQHFALTIPHCLLETRILDACQGHFEDQIQYSQTLVRQVPRHGRQAINSYSSSSKAKHQHQHMVPPRSRQPNESGHRSGSSEHILRQTALEATSVCEDFCESADHPQNVCPASRCWWTRRTVFVDSKCHPPCHDCVGGIPLAVNYWWWNCRQTYAWLVALHGVECTVVLQ
jgi:hypothetical protein